jgi:hypothetical protein
MSNLRWLSSLAGRLRALSLRLHGARLEMPWRVLLLGTYGVLGTLLVWCLRGYCGRNHRMPEMTSGAPGLVRPAAHGRRAGADAGEKKDKRTR